VVVEISVEHGALIDNLRRVDAFDNGRSHLAGVRYTRLEPLVVTDDAPRFVVDRVNT
jgi:hypothetical protein